MADIPLRPTAIPRPACDRPVRTPEEHYAEADRILRELDGLDMVQLSLPFNQRRLDKAQIHAMLAQCVLPYVVAAEEVVVSGATGQCQVCKSAVHLDPLTNDWVHTASGTADCFIKTTRIETATPERKYL